MQKTTAIIAGAIAALITVQFSVQARAQQPQVTEPGTDIGTFYKDEEGPLYKAPGYSPYAGRNYPTRVLWGDTHLHTANSLDAAAFGNTLGPEEAYRFVAGTLTLTSATPQEGAECKNINYDPLVMSDGIAPTDDPVLLFRSPSYALSFVKRLQGQ
jgi:hypothetical protein